MSVGSCPKCGGRKIRASRTRSSREEMLKHLGIAPFRCRHCGHRFANWIFSYSTVRYAHCPKCLGATLKPWSEPYLRVGSLNRLKILLGARKYRCEKCRCNFASFRGVAPARAET